MTDEVVAPGPVVIEQNTSGVVGVLAEALAQHHLASLLYDEGRCACGYWFDVADDPHPDRIRRMHREHVASVVAALPNIAIVPKSGRIEVITHAQNGDLIAREIGTSRHIAIAHIGSQPHSFANAPEALALKAEGYAALSARAAGGQA